MPTAPHLLLFQIGGDTLLEMQDADLLRAYVADANESAFADLVRRYVDLVYSTALRHAGGESGLAEDVTQAVFLLLARKAPTLLAHPSLAGWLYRTAAHLGARTHRSEQRRRARERDAAHMNSHDSPPSELERIVPLLDAGLQALNEPDRLALLLRFFMKQSMQEVGRALGVSEAAAKMRVGRAMERLRNQLAQRGVSCTSAALALALTNQVVTAAPVHLTKALLTSLSSTSLALSPGSFGSLILMSKTNALIVSVVLLALFTAGVRHFTSPSRSTAPEQSAGALNSPPVSAPYTPPGGGTSILARLGSAASPESVAAERLRAALGAPQPKGSTLWPDEEVIRQVRSHPNPRAAFEILKAAVADPAALLPGEMPGSDPAFLVRLRAISAMRDLAKDVPAVVPYLWETFESEDPGTKVHAFSTLKAIGLSSGDLRPLVQSLPSSGRSPALVRFVPQAIAKLLAQYPQAGAPAVTALKELLDSPDDAARFMSATALAGTHLTQDPRVADVLRQTLTSGNTTRALSTAEALANAGPAAAPFAPALLELAQSTTEPHLRAEYLRAAAAIQPEVVQQQEEVAAVLARDALARELESKLERESATLDDLVTALALPQFTTTAAVRLGELGLAASNAVPVMVKALEGQDEAARDKILEAIHRVEPNTPIERIDAETTSAAVIHAEISLGDRVHNHADPATQFLLDKRKYSTWWTRPELITVAQQLARLDPGAYRAFAEKVLGNYPELKAELPPVVE